MSAQKPDHKSIVAKDNELIGQMAKFDLSELRLIAYCLAHYDSRKPENRSFFARVDDLTELFPISPSSAYRVIKQTMLKLGKKPLEIREGSKKKYWNWFSGFVYDEGNGEFEFRITPEIQPYLLKLEGNFTRYRLGDVYQFKAASTWKLYELLKQWFTAGTWRVELDELRLLLGVAGKYPRWDSLKTRIVDPAKSEINETSDLAVSYEKEKKGRRIVALVFKVEETQPDDVINVESGQEGLYKALMGHGFKHPTATRLAREVDREDKAQLIIDRLPQMAKNAKAKQVPLAKYMTGAINQELKQGQLFDDLPPKAVVPDHKEALDCWQAKRQTGEECKVRKRGKPGQRKKCKLCFAELPIANFGV